MQVDVGSGMVELGRLEGAYLSAQLKPREARSGEELHRDIDSVIHSHNARRDNVKRLVAERSLRATA